MTIRADLLQEMQEHIDRSRASGRAKMKPKEKEERWHYQGCADGFTNVLYALAAVQDDDTQIIHALLFIYGGLRFREAHGEREFGDLMAQNRYQDAYHSDGRTTAYNIAARIISEAIRIHGAITSN